MAEKSRLRGRTAVQQQDCIYLGWLFPLQSRSPTHKLVSPTVSADLFFSVLPFRQFLTDTLRSLFPRWLRILSIITTNIKCHTFLSLYWAPSPSSGTTISLLKHTGPNIVPSPATWVIFFLNILNLLSSVKLQCPIKKLQSPAIQMWTYLRCRISTTNISKSHSC